MRYRFDSFELDGGDGRLRRGGALVDLSREGADVLRHLVEHAGAPVSPGALKDALGPASSAGDDAIAGIVRDLRRTVGDGTIQDAHDGGYRFVAEVERDVGGDAAVIPSRTRWPLMVGIAILLAGVAIVVALLLITGVA
jgi:DNA-binding winged helix-turn-helix (wHTH) protein